MSSALAGSLLVIAAGIAANPPGIIVQLGLLSSKNGRGKAVAYLLGLLTSLVAFAVLAYAIFGKLDLSSKGTPSNAHYAVLAVGGLIVIGAGVWLWRQPAEAVGGFVGKAIEDLDSVKLSVAFVLGFLLVNYPLEVAGATSIMQAQLGSPTTAAAYFAAYVVVASSTIWLPLVLAIAMPGPWARWSAAIVAWVTIKGNVVLGVLIVGIGVLVSFQGLMGFLNAR
jgi:hypothetical protein